MEIGGKEWRGCERKMGVLAEETVRNNERDREKRKVSKRNEKEGGREIERGREQEQRERQCYRRKEEGVRGTIKQK